MKTHSDDELMTEILEGPKNLLLASKIFSASSDPAASIGDPVRALLGRRENSRFVQKIRELFPNALNIVGKVSLMKAVEECCRKRLQQCKEWQVSPVDFDNHEVTEVWPCIYIQPKHQRRAFWYFELGLDARKIPYTFVHGIALDCDRQTRIKGKPKVMSQQLETAVRELEQRLKQRKLVTERNRTEASSDDKPGSAWLAKDKKVYRNWTIGDKPAVIIRLSEGTLADDIAAEFVQLFTRWHADVERLNKLLK
jgi:hypothetical protein